jgi:hypothetical protein
MLVETYEAGEGVGQAEVDEESRKLMEQLGLEGQLGLATGFPAAGTNPYSEMTLEQKVTFRALFPETTEIARYARGPIPLRVLQVAAHAAGLFEKLEVWHSRHDADPLLVGLVKGPESYSDPRPYLLARWGDLLDPFGELVKKARAVIRERLKAYWEEQASEAAGRLQCLDALVTKHFNGEFVGIHR